MRASQYIEMQTMPIQELAKSPPGTSAPYIVRVPDGVSADVAIQRIRSNLKAACTHAGTRCKTETGAFLTGLTMTGRNITRMDGILVTILESTKP